MMRFITGVLTSSRELDIKPSSVLGGLLCPPVMGGLL